MAQTVSPWRSAWTLPPDVTFLNHGSFGLVPREVQTVREDWQRALYANPMDFFLRQMEGALAQTATHLGKLVGADSRDLVLVDNATFGMNIVAQSLRLEKGDEVLLTDHEYGAVRRIWQKRCEKVGAEVVVRELPRPIEHAAGLVSQFLAGVTTRTKLIVISQITSPTATILPVAEICREARKAGVPVCIDGPHAIAALPLRMNEIDCDFYCASCHKWLAAPNGSGFLYVRRNQQSLLEPHVVSWGGSIGGHNPTWQGEYNWQGTRDPSACLAIGAAINFLERAGWEHFRESSHRLVRLARQWITELTGLDALVPDSPEWYGPMISLPLPTQGLSAPAQGKRDPLQDRLWDEYRIEVPITWWHGQRLLRVSCHLYNTEDDIDKLCRALTSCLAAG